MAYTDIDKPSDYFNTVLYTGNGSTQSITGVGFQPDWTWIKYRNAIDNHALFDSIRGATKILQSNVTNAEATVSTALTSFDSDGFSLGSDGQENTNGGTYASWNWLAGGTASSNTNGSITSSVSANTTSGFSIVSYTGNGTAGATVGHGLGVAPKMVIVKNRTSVRDWLCYHVGLGSAVNFIALNLSSGYQTNNSVWNSTSPDSSKFTLGTSSYINESGSNHIAYCFAEKKGFSKFGSYTGNGSSDGTFVYTGFKPAFVIIKKSSASGDNWHTWDSTRDTFNVVNKRLVPNDSVQEYNNFNVLDFCSNGFKLRDGSTYWNQSGGTFIYMCFAESPFTTSTGIPTTAR